MIVIFLFFTMCQYNNEQPQKIEKNILSQQQSLLKKPVKDSIRIIDTLNKVIEWKLQNMNTFFIDTLDFPLPEPNKLQFQWSNNQYVAFKAKCGYPCWYTYVFPLVKKNKIKRYFYSIGYSVEKKLIVYQPNDLEDKYMLRIKNVTTDKFYDIEREYCPADLSYLCIGKISFSDENLIIEWKKDFFADISTKLTKNETIIKLPNYLTVEQ